MSYKAVTKIEFTAEITREISSTPTIERLGKKKCTMELWTEYKNQSKGKIIKSDLRGVGDIEWIWDIGTENEDVCANIGVWWDDKKRLTDYDGVFSLPSQAIKLLNKAGIVVPKEFRNL